MALGSEAQKVRDEYYSTVSSAVGHLRSGVETVFSRNIDAPNKEAIEELLDWLRNDSFVSDLITNLITESQRQAHGYGLKEDRSVQAFQSGHQERSVAEQHIARAVIKTLDNSNLIEESLSELEKGNVRPALKELGRRVEAIMMLEVVFNSHPMYVVARMRLLSSYNQAYSILKSFDDRYPNYTKNFVNL